MSARLIPTRGGGSADYAAVLEGSPRSWWTPARSKLLLLGGAILTAVVVGLAVGLRKQPAAAPSAAPLSAIAVLNNRTVTGTVSFSQTPGSTFVVVTVALQGVPASSGWAPGQSHGLHIHNSSNLGNACLNAGPHFNPSGAVHGGRASTIRHAGDLGNVTADGAGAVSASFSVEGLSLESGDAGYIVGRSVMLHADADDGGVLGFADSATTGHAGARIACGAIVAPLAGGRGQ